MGTATCPFCDIQFPSSEIEWHANKHLDEDEFSRDRELAVQLASSAEPPLQILVAETRFASHTIVLRRLVRVKEALCQMVISNKWGGWKQVDTEKAKIVKDLIFSDDFWNRVEYALELTEPLMSMLRYANTDEPCLGNIYDAMDYMLERMKSVIQRREQDLDTLYSTVEKIVLHRWNKMTTPLHLLAYALFPRYYSSEILDIPGRVPPYRDPEVAAGYKRALNRLFSDPDVASNVRREFVDFVSGKFAEPDAINDQSRLDAIGWWYLHGECYMYLQPLAIKILSQGRDVKLAEHCSSEIVSEKKDLLSILDGDHIYSQVSCLISCQTKSNFYMIEEGLMNLLRNCLEAEHGLTCCAISGHIDHFQSTRSEDLGWGCGWRNIQMLSSHLLMQISGARDMLFGGSGFIPDIPSLQRWLEIAWKKGFDIMGAESFNFGIYGSKKWIGTTECATLLRSFGLRARIVDFGCEAVNNRKFLSDTPKLNQAVQGSREMLRTNHTNGPLHKFLHFEYECDGCKTYPIRGSVYTCRERENFHVCSACMDKGIYSLSEFLETDTACSNNITNNVKESYKGQPDNHQVLVDWVWNYFVEDKNMHSKVPLCQLQECIITSQRTPLYFQHNGHSRTIVGIQRRYKSLNRRDEEVFLLVLDPAQRTEELASALRGNKGWQKLVKRGLHTLRKPEYQLCYVDPGIAHGEELEQLKILESEVFKY